MSRSISGASPRQGASLLSAVDPMVIIRCTVGFFYLPHVLGKIIGFAGSVGFFTKAGFQPPEFWVIVSGSMELLVGLALLFGIFTKYAAILSIGLMLVAAGAQIIFKGQGFLWYWNFGGIEYLIYWALASLAVFLAEWRKNPGVFGLFKNL